uniref:Lysosomal dipeptide transporter MFSD1 n=1 Tax=Strigamia maritima TaxID=126957 RepID=T1INA2_STRMM
MDDETSPLLVDRKPVRPINESNNETETELSGCGATLCCNPYRPFHRFVTVIFMCFLSFGSYFCYDNPGALQTSIKNVMGISTEEFMQFYAWYSWPNVILSLIGGFLIDRVFGIRLGAIIFAAFVMGGQLVFAAGAFAKSYYLMIFGRFVFGIGGESLAVSQNTYAVSWFYGKELNMVFGLQLSFARIGSTVNFLVMQPIYDFLAESEKGYTLLGLALMIAALTTVISLACALILAFLDKRAEKILNKQTTGTGEVIRFKDILYFPLSFWLISIVCVSYYVAIFPFIGLGNEFFTRKFGMSISSANTVTSLVYSLSAVASPLLGYLIDRTGRNVIWVFFAVLLTILSHGTLAFTFINPFVPMVLMGISYSMLASGLWPMVAFIIPAHQLGTAYGIMQSVQNLGLAVFSIITGNIVDNSGYLVLEVLNLASLCVALLCVVVLWIIDMERGGTLNLSTAQRKLIARELETTERLEQDRLFASGSMADVTPQDLLHSRTDFSIRNRYLSRLGATVR